MDLPSQEELKHQLDQSRQKQIKTFAQVVGKTMSRKSLLGELPEAGRGLRKEGASLEALIHQCDAKAEMVTEGSKAFLAVHVLPRFL